MSIRPEQIEPPVDRVSVEPVGGFSWRPFAVIGLIAVVLGLAVVKPWDANRPAPQLVARPVASPTPVVTASPQPTIDPLIDAASSRMLCNAPAGWRLVSMETGPLGDTRTMYGIEPATASGPTDPSIPTAQLHDALMFGVGVCRPNPGGLRVADLPFNSVTVWDNSDPSQPRAVANPFVLDDALFRLGEVYLGPPRDTNYSMSNGRVAPSWQPGRYVLEIADATRGGDALWLALDFTNIQAATGTVPDQ